MFNKKKIKELEDKIEVLEKWRDDILDKEWRKENPDGIVLCNLVKNYMGCDWEEKQIFRLFYGKRKFIDVCEFYKDKHVIRTNSKNNGNGRFKLEITYTGYLHSHYYNCEYRDVSEYFLVDTKTEMVYNVDSEGRLI